MKSSRTLDRREDEYADQSQVFYSVIDAIQQISNLPLTSFVPYDDEVQKSRTITPPAIEDTVDVSLAAKKVLTETEQQDAYDALVRGEKVKPYLAQKIIRRCGRIFKSRNLSPGSYFRPSIRRGSVESRQRLRRAA